MKKLVCINGTMVYREDPKKPKKESHTMDLFDTPLSRNKTSGGSMRFVELFAGIGGFSLGFERAGMECVGHVEIEEYPQKVLKKHWPKVPLYPDVKKIKGDEFGEFEVLCGGFPCQDLSVAGKQKGITGERSGLFDEIIRIARVCRPKFIVLENVANLLSRTDWFGYVLGRFAEIGMYVEWRPISAKTFGFPHGRDRVFIVAHSHGERWGKRCAEKLGCNKEERKPSPVLAESSSVGYCKNNKIKSEFIRVDDGFSRKLDGGVVNEKRSNKEMFKMWSNIYKESFLDWKIRGPNNILEKKILWENVSKQGINKGWGDIKANLDGKSKEVQKKMLSQLWRRQQTAHTPFGQKHIEQQAEQLVDIVCYLSQSNPCKEKRIQDKHRLKCLGNSLVPQIAEYIGHQLMRVA